MCIHTGPSSAQVLMLVQQQSMRVQLCSRNSVTAIAAEGKQAVFNPFHVSTGEQQSVLLLSLGLFGVPVWSLHYFAYLLG